jgi:hypothetical protein
MLLYGRAGDAGARIMPTYDLNALGAAEFESLTQSLVKAVIGAGTITFGAGADGAREATFSGRAPYPSELEQWDGEWIFQAKFHDLTRVAADRARATVVRELDHELDKVVNKYKHRCDNFVLITNVPLSSTARSGSHDTIAQKIAPKYGHAVEHVHVWGFDDVSRLLERYPEVRQNYLHLLTPGDLIAQLMRGVGHVDIAETIRLFLASDYQSDRFANLDQAGEVGDESVSLTRIFVDLDVALREGEQPSIKSINPGGALAETEWSAFMRGEDTSAMRLLLCEEPERVVIIGGPGQGKSTLGQFLAQIHRSSLLGKLSDVIGPHGEFTPLRARIPLRVILRDYAQWATQQHEAGDEDASVERYLAARIERLAANGIPVSKADVHSIIRDNPCLCIFDGLDEVVDPRLRNEVLTEIRAFLERAELGLKADLHVIGTSRPTGYLDEFDPASFTHVRLKTLSSEKAQSYADRWIDARVPSESRSSRIREAFAESLGDPQVSLLIHTPLQVTIVLYVILSGDSPSRQRESLFSDYVDVIYRRERAKHRSMITTEKDVLLGLHEYLGYLIHRRAGDPSHVNAALTAEEFDAEVRAYLLHSNPWSTQEQLDEQVRTLVTEAQDRLVLLVEGVPGQFGFELRSLQEYFAAAHLAQTAKDSDQRYRRFEAIARSTHWRNAALFFAGRIGRLHRGEAANLVAACRTIDASPPDTMLRRGCSLALDLALDRAFGSHQPLQHLVVGEALAISESDPVNWTPGDWTRRLGELPADDVRNHVLPVLERHLGVQDIRHQRSTVSIYHGLDRGAEPVCRVLRSWLESRDATVRLMGLEVALLLEFPADWIRPYAPGAVEGAPAKDAAGVLSAVAASDPVYLARALSDVKFDAGLARELIEAMRMHGFVGRPAEEVIESLSSGDQPDPESSIVRSGLFGLCLAQSLGRRHGLAYSQRSYPGDFAGTLWDLLEPWLREPAELNSTLGVYMSIARTVWQLRMQPCDVSVAQDLVGFIRTADDPGQALEFTWQIGGMNSEALQSLILLLDEGTEDRPQLTSACELVAAFSGPLGAERWDDVQRRLSSDLPGLPRRDRLEILLGNSPRWRRPGRARTLERATGLDRDEIWQMLVLTRGSSMLVGDDLALDVVARAPRLLESGNDMQRAGVLRALVKAFSESAVVQLPGLPSFHAVVDWLVTHHDDSPRAPHALRLAALAMAADGGDVSGRLERALEVVGTADRTWAYVRLSDSDAISALHTLGGILAASGSASVRKAASQCVADITSSAGSRNVPDQSETSGGLAALVERLIAAEDDLTVAAAVRMLPVIPGSPWGTLADPLASLRRQLDDDLQDAWIYAFGALMTPLDETLRAALSAELQALLASTEFSEPLRRMIYTFLRKLSDAEAPAINDLESQLGLPLPPAVIRSD